MGRGHAPAGGRKNSAFLHEMIFYNEHDPKAAAWLRELIKQKQIPAGHVDERSITEIKPHELAQYTQCHFFAGIGGWSYALQLAGIPITQPVWTGSCPCQPFSTAGEQKGVFDERHLWPAFFNLIRECRPNHVFGEQVANAIGHGWLDGISADLEAEKYSCGAAVLGAACTAKPHLRQRLYWYAHNDMFISAGKVLPSVGRQGSGHSVRGWSPQDEQERYRGFDELVSMGIGKRVASYSEALSLLHGIPSLVDLMRGSGNAIVPQTAAVFIQASFEAIIDPLLGIW